MQRRPRRSKKPKLLLIVGLILLLLVGAAVAWWFMRPDAESNVSNEQNEQQVIEEDPYSDRIRLIASGDTVAHDSVNLNAEQADGSYDYYPLLQDMEQIFSAADIRFCNQSTPAGGEEFGVAGYPEFNAPTELVRDLGKLGCNVVNTASNHSFDVGQEAITANTDAWEAVDSTLAVVGQNRNAAERDKVTIFEVKGVKIAFLAYTTYINSNAPATNDFGVNQYSREFAGSQITAAKEAGAEIIITSMRWGTEYAQTIDGAQETEGNWLASQGVDLVLGHGPHVLQPVKEIENADGSTTVIWYSLGNFLNTQLEIEALFNGIAVVDFDRNSKEITYLGYLPGYSSYSWTAEQAAAEDLLSRQNVKISPFDDVTQATIDANQLETTLEAQSARIRDTLNTFTTINLLTKQQFLD